MNPNHETKIVIAGFGGQGVVLAGTILTRAAVAAGRYATLMVSYGVEMRGGTANSTVVISPDVIASPIVDRPDIAIVLNQPSADRFEPLIEPDGVLVVNTTEVKKPCQRDDLDVVTIAASEIAKEMGNIRVANMVACGALLTAMELVSTDDMKKAIQTQFAQKKPALTEINQDALMRGIRQSRRTTCRQT